MEIIDTIVSREGDNSAWATVVFVGVHGETVSVRIPCPVPTGGQIGRGRIVKRAGELLRAMMESDTFARLGEEPWSTPGGRFGAASAAPGSIWRNDAESGEEQ